MVNLSYHIRSSANEGFEANTRKLVIEAGTGHVIVMLWNREQRMVESAEVFTGIQVWPESWGQMVQQSSLLNLRHLETEVFLNSERFLPTPAVLYDPTETDKQISVLFGDEISQSAAADVLMEEGMVIGWQADSEIVETLKGHFQMVQLHPFASLLAKMNNFEDAHENHGVLVVSGHLAWVAVWRKAELLLLRAISANEPDNVAYFLLNACKTWGIEPQKIAWKIGGLVETDSPLWLAAERFYQNFEPMKGSLVKNDIPEHFFGHLTRYLL